MSVPPVPNRPYTLVLLVSIAALGILAFWRLDQYPLIWFDEGSHLHVPKTLVQFGVYADRSSEGFRYFGPSTGVGPTVMLPIAGSFAVLGIGLWQARLVVALYLMGCAVAFYAVARRLGGLWYAWIATVLFVSSRGAPAIEYGRQVLGEVPALFFLLCGTCLWFAAMTHPSTSRLAVVGLLFGLAAVTKQQTLIVLVPALVVGWLANLTYYRAVPHRVFLLPVSLCIVLFAGWQGVLVLALSPLSLAENLRQLSQTASGAAVVFSPTLLERSVRELLDWKVFLGALLPSVIYAIWQSRARTILGLSWAFLTAFVLVNLLWYAIASIGWLRYAFPALAIAALFVAKLIEDWAGGFGGKAPPGSAPGAAPDLWVAQGLRLAGLGWLVMMILIPLAQTVREIVSPPFNAPAAMAEYLDEHISRTVLIETWEPEMGFLTDHTFHYPPQSLLNTAVAHIWRGGPPPSESYDFDQPTAPPYVLVGKFARWVGLYPPDVLVTEYELVYAIGGYELYGLR